ncbi:hypothetical protein [Capnocytophaga canis]|uniref:Uncharacterized protein n=2 Tax=Capnocytophaga canis TaxID=1848903 RepID=A0A0B7IRB8_9FLAO|nr:hypothetical protein [Capnocytophaga canis]CEN54436.1 conserved hypothetical protein [Capnocytophaga canis]
MITLNIPLPAYLYKYLTALYPTPYQPSQRDELGLVILTALERKMTTEGCSELKTWKGKSITHSFPVELSLSQFEKKGFYIFNDKIHYMQTFIDNHFRNSLYRTAVINYNHFNIPYKDSILTFLATYGIDEEDFPYESIRKDFNRKAEVIRKRLAK